nr:capsid [Bat associated circovirus]
MVFKRRTNIRKRFRRRKPRFRRHIPRLMGKGDAVRFFKLRRSYDVNSSASGGLQVAFNDDPSGYIDWTPISQLFDQYRVAAIKIKYIPSYMDTFSTATAGTSNTFTPMWVFYDPDSANFPGGVTTAANALEYENCRGFNPLRHWKYYHKCRKNTVMQAAAVSVGVGWFDVASFVGSQSICMLLVNQPVSIHMGTIIYTMYLMARNRR